MYVDETKLGLYYPRVYCRLFYLSLFVQTIYHVLTLICRDLEPY